MTSDYDMFEARERFFEIHNNKLDKRPREKVSDSQILMCFNGRGNNLQKASNIARALDISLSTARRRLKKLEDMRFVYRERIDQTDIWTVNRFWTSPWSEKVMEHLESKVSQNE